MVGDKELKGVIWVTLGFDKRTNLEVLQYIFKSFGWATLGDKYYNAKSTRKSYEPRTPIGWIFDHIDEGQKYTVAAIATYLGRQMASLGEISVLKKGQYTTRFKEWRLWPESNFYQVADSSREMHISLKRIYESQWLRQVFIQKMQQQ